MYTIEERLEIYERMLKDFSLTDYDELTHANANSGFCFWYSRRFTEDSYGLLHNFENRLPELWESRPDFVDNEYHDFWFDKFPVIQTDRVKCLKKVIETTKNLIKCKI